MTLNSIIRQERQKQGMTQVALAFQAEVSLPALQQLEAGNSNPSLETLERLSRILGLELRLEPKGCNWDKLSALGLPITPSAHYAVAGSPEELIREMRLGLRELSVSQDSRKTEALAGLLLALSEHYPKLYRRAFGRNPEAQALIAHPTGKIIKLKRLSLSRISEYL